MTFDEWWEKESGWGGEHLAEYQLAKASWNKAIEQAANKVRANYDPCEPWLEVSDIEDLGA